MSLVENTDSLTANRSAVCICTKVYASATTFGVIASLDLQDEVTTISVILTSQSSISQRFAYFALKSGNKRSEP